MGISTEAGRRGVVDQYILGESQPRPFLWTLCAWPYVLGHVCSASQPSQLRVSARPAFRPEQSHGRPHAWPTHTYTHTAPPPPCPAFHLGLCWVLEYYYRGVASWTWYYPYHYAPCASDLRALTSVHVAFERGEPFLPYQQLLAVQPASSCRLLPQPYQVTHSRGCCLPPAGPAVTCHATS
jgi:hypothetical protein